MTQVYAKIIGIGIATGKIIFSCPKCYVTEKLEGKPFLQQMSSIGDHEDTLFCPHCGMEIDLIVRDKYPVKI